MKYVIVLIILIFSKTYFLFAQPSIQWQQTFGGSGNDYAYSMQQTSDGGFIIAGTSDSNDSDITVNNGGRDYWIIKLNNAGIKQWQHSYGGSADDFANCIQQTNDAGYIIAGYTESNDSDVTSNHGHRDFWIVKTDSSGTIDWQKTYGGSDFEIAYAIQQTIDGGYIVAGYSNSIDGDLAGTFANAQNYWLLKINNLGTIQWFHLYGGAATDEALSVQQTSDYGFIISGYTYSSSGHVTGYHGMKDAWVVKTDSTGTLLWQKTLGGTDGESANCIRQTSDGGFIAACSSSSVDDDVTGNHGGSDSWIVKLDSAGTIEWQKALGGTASDGAYFIEQTTDGGYIFCGYTTSNDGDVTYNHGDFDIWIVKLSNTGNIEWQKSLGGTGIDVANSILQTIDGGFIIAGSTSSNDGDVTGNNGSSDFWIVKLDSAQNVSVNELIKPFIDFSIFPNPFSKEIVISFRQSTSEKIKIEIRDIESLLIKNLTSEIFKIGSNEIAWDATNNSGSKVENGLYFITIVSDNFSETKKVVVLRD